MSGGIFWLSSYPKSGNTWTRCLIASLSSGGAPPDRQRIDDVCPTILNRATIECLTDAPSTDMTPGEIRMLRASAHRTFARQQASPRFVKIHDAYDPALFPDDVTLGVVLIVRDPRGVAPSFAAHLARTIDETIERMARPTLAFARLGPGLPRQVEQSLDSWSGHANSWLACNAAPRLLLKYEDLQAEPLSQMRRLADFLGVDADDAVIERTVRGCRFDALQAAEARDGYAGRPPTLKTFFRRGRADWRDELTPAQDARIVADHSQTMRRLGYPGAS